MPPKHHSSKPSYLENVNIGFEICQKAKEQFVCSNDIIPRSELPFLFADEIGKATQKFGPRRLNLYLNHLNQLKSARDYLHSVGSKDKIGTTLIDVVLTYFGMGECQESASFTVYELLKKGRTDFASIILHGAPDAGDPTRIYLHNLILLGSQFPKHGPIDSLNSLPDDVVVIDPYLNHVGPANTYLRDQNPYLSALQFTSIPVIAVNPIKTDILKSVQDQIDLLLSKVREKLTPFNSRELLIDSGGEICRNEAVTQLNEYVARAYPHLPAKFFGISDKVDRSVSAVIEIKTLENAAVCVDLKQKFNMGYFSRGGKHALFTFTDVREVPVESDNILKNSP